MKLGLINGECGGVVMTLSSYHPIIFPLSAVSVSCSVVYPCFWLSVHFVFWWC